METKPGLSDLVYHKGSWCPIPVRTTTCSHMNQGPSNGRPGMVRQCSENKVSASENEEEKMRAPLTNDVFSDSCVHSLQDPLDGSTSNLISIHVDT